MNPYVRGGAPIILVPADILGDLPIAKDWSDVAAAASKNAELRNRVNDQIAQLWTAKTLKDKNELRRWAMSGKEPFETLLDMIRGASPTAYDMLGERTDVDLDANVLLLRHMKANGPMYRERQGEMSSRPGTRGVNRLAKTEGKEPGSNLLRLAIATCLAKIADRLA